MGSIGKCYIVYPLPFLATAGFCDRGHRNVAIGVYRMVEKKCLSNHWLALVHQYIWLGNGSASKTRFFMKMKEGGYTLITMFKTVFVKFSVPKSLKNWNRKI